MHPGATVDDVVDATGFDLVIEGDVPETPVPDAETVEILRRIDPTGARGASSSAPERADLGCCAPCSACTSSRTSRRAWQELFAHLSEQENLEPLFGARIRRLSDGTDGTRNGAGASREG